MLAEAERVAEPVLDVLDLCPAGPLAFGEAYDQVVALVRLRPLVFWSWTDRMCFTAQPGSSWPQLVARAHATFSPACGVSRM